MTPSLHPRRKLEALLQTALNYERRTWPPASEMISTDTVQSVLRVLEE
jgi:hypothetical protein